MQSTRSFFLFLFLFPLVSAPLAPASADGMDYEEESPPAYPSRDSGGNISIIVISSPEEVEVMPPLVLDQQRTAIVRPFSDCPDETHCARGYELLGVFIGSAGNVGAAAALRPDRFSVSSGSSAHGGNPLSLSGAVSGSDSNSSSTSDANANAEAVSTSMGGAGGAGGHGGKGGAGGAGGVGKGGDGGSASVGDISVRQDQKQGQEQGQKQAQGQEQGQKLVNQGPSRHDRGKGGGKPHKHKGGKRH